MISNGGMYNLKNNWQRLDSNQQILYAACYNVVVLTTESATEMHYSGN